MSNKNVENERMSNKNVENESWNDQKAELKQIFLGLTNNNYFLELSEREEWLEKAQIKFGKTKEELLQLISNI